MGRRARAFAGTLLGVLALCTVAFSVRLIVERPAGNTATPAGAEAAPRSEEERRFARWRLAEPHLQKAKEDGEAKIKAICGRLAEAVRGRKEHVPTFAKELLQATTIWDFAKAGITGDQSEFNESIERLLATHVLTRADVTTLVQSMMKEYCDGLTALDNATLIAIRHDIEELPIEPTQVGEAASAGKPVLAFSGNLAANYMPGGMATVSILGVSMFVGNEIGNRIAPTIAAQIISRFGVQAASRSGTLIAGAARFVVPVVAGDVVDRGIEWMLRENHLHPEQLAEEKVNAWLDGLAEMLCEGDGSPRDADSASTDISKVGLARVLQTIHRRHAETREKVLRRQIVLGEGAEAAETAVAIGRDPTSFVGDAFLKGFAESLSEATTVADDASH